MSQATIDIDDDLLARVQRLLGTSTEQDTINAALRELLRQAAVDDFMQLGREGGLHDAAQAKVMSEAWR
jgi:Arc/MetJ family transcription regulator